MKKKTIVKLLMINFLCGQKNVLFLREKYFLNSSFCSVLEISDMLGCHDHHLYINLACLFVCLYPINVKTIEPIGPKFFVGHHETPGKVYG